MVVCDVGEKEGIIRAESRSDWGSVGGRAEEVKKVERREGGGGVWECGRIDREDAKGVGEKEGFRGGELEMFLVLDGGNGGVWNDEGRLCVAIERLLGD